MHTTRDGSVLGILATKAAVLLPLFGVLWWYASIVHLATGWTHPQDFDSWDGLLEPVQYATVPFAHHPAFWLQIVTSYLVSTIWMLRKYFRQQIPSYWVIPALATLPILFFTFCSLFSGPNFFLLVGMTVLYAQPLAAHIYLSKNRRQALWQSGVALALIFSFGALTCPSSWDGYEPEDHTTPIGRLLRYGMSPSARNAKGDTLLHCLPQYEDVQGVTTLLLQYGADPNVRNYAGKTPIHVLDHYSDSETMMAIRKQLIAAGADPNAKVTPPLSK